MTDPPNILWIVTTQWRAQACGYAGDPNARTPCLDRLAASGVNYAQAVSPHPFGPFARAALLTGRPSPANGVRDYFDPLPAGARTVAHDLRERGYATAFFGKWHLGRRDPSAPLVGEAHARTIVPPEARGGFEFWEGFESGFLLNDPWLHGTRLPEPSRFSGYQTQVLAARFRSWLLEVGGDERPWFAVLSLEPPHPPYGARAGSFRTRDPREIVLPSNVPLGGTAEKRARRELAGYYSHIEANDFCLGLLLNDLGADASAGSPDAATHRGFTTRPPIAVFTSVHGDMHGAHGLFRKGWPYEESLRVPFLVRRPVEPPRRDDAAVSLLDLPEMTRSWADDRRWVAPSAARISMPSVVALPDQCDRVWRGLRTPRRKLILNEDGTPWLFFDLDEDPFELRNLVQDARRKSDMAALVAQERAESDLR